MSAALALMQVPVCDYFIDAGRDDAGIVWVSVRAASEVLGLASNMQIEKLKAKPWACGMFIISHDATGRKQEVFCIPLRALPMWLATIQTSRVRPELRPTLSRFQCEAADVLAAHFLGAKAIPTPPPVVVADDTPAQIRELRARVHALEGRVAGLVAPFEQLALPLLEAPKVPRDPTPLDRLLVAWKNLAIIAGDPRGMTAAEVVARLRSHGGDLSSRVLSAAFGELGAGDAVVDAKRMGYVLRRYSRKPSGGLVLTSVKTHGERRWLVAAARPQAVRGVA